MRRRSPRGAALSLLAAIGVVGGPCATAAAAPARPASDAVRVTAAFDADATLGAATALDVDLRLDPRRLSHAQLTEVRLEYPRRVGIVSGGLGLAACTRPASDFAAVLVSVDSVLGGCPANAVIGYGTARAIVRLTSGQAIPEYATVTLLSGPIEHGRLGLVVYVDGQRPFGAKLAFAGELLGAPPPYGGALAVRMPVVPGIADLATISLVDLHVVVGSHAIRYRERRGGRIVSYRPDGVELPLSCPRGGFRFHAQVAFADGSRRAAGTSVPCPRAVAAPRGSR